MESEMARSFASLTRRRLVNPPEIEKSKMKRTNRIVRFGAALTLLLSACSLAPPLKVPVVPAEDAYKEIGPWTQAQPADRLARDSWWALYGNAELNELETKLIAGNPTLAAALAN